jgi:hypothetical protein
MTTTIHLDNAIAPNTSLQPIPIALRANHDTVGASAYRAILQRKIDEGARRAAQVIATIQQDQPRDQIIRAHSADFDVAERGIRFRVADDGYAPSDFALGQIAGRAEVPLPYLRELAAPEAELWQRHPRLHHPARALCKRRKFPRPHPQRPWRASRLAQRSLPPA